jgi:transcriptional regulator with XRE-family HTH domain
MVATPSPPVRRKRLGSELRRLREQARLTCDGVGRRLDCSGTRISRIETGRISARPGDVREMLEVYGVTGDDAEFLVQLARDARRKGWWQAYGPVIPPWFESYLSLESEAAGIREFAPMTLPGLVQTEDYARAQLAGAAGSGSAAGQPGTPADIDAQVALRREWQARLGQPGAPRLALVIGESALRTEAGGGPEVMRAQLDHLREMAALPAVSLQVLLLRSSAGIHAVTPFTILDFADRADAPAVYLEYLTGSLVLEAADEVRRYAAVFGELRSGALATADSAGFISQLAGHPDDAGDL